MEVETYEATEVLDSGVEASEEQIKLIEELGLDGQKEFLSEDKAEIFPYPLMTDEERFVYGTLFEQKTEVHNYNGDPMPVRILQAIAFAKGFEEVKHLYVLSEPFVSMDDPILIATSSQIYGSIKGENRIWLIGRWGKALAPFKTLKVMAEEYYRKMVIAKNREAIQELEKRNELMKDPEFDVSRHKNESLYGMEV